MSKSCEFSSSEQRLQEEDHKALLRNAENLKRELEKLQNLNGKFSGACVYSNPSSKELWSLYTRLRQGLLSVKEQKAKEEPAILAKKEEMGPENAVQYMDDNFTSEMQKQRLRRSARDSLVSSETRLEDYDHEALLQISESMESEIETLGILNK